jgi:ABC-2 type transport system ATP-binding protein
LPTICVHRWSVSRVSSHSESVRSGHSSTVAQPRLGHLVQASPSSPLLRIDGLTKRYPGVTALDNLSVEVPRGRIGLVGANGAGKTTTFRLLLGLAHATEGRIEVCGIDVARDPIGVRSRLGYMPEHDCLPLDQTAADVVSTFGEMSGLPARAARQRASDILDLVGLDEARFRPIGGFSTGMRQRAKLAQALVGDPELVLLDEPTAGLDPLGREDMLALVARLGSFGISVLMATHLLDDVQKVCDHVVMIDAGKLVVSGATDSLLERTGTLTIDVGPHHEALVAGLRGVQLTAVVVEGLVEVKVDRDEQNDTVRDVIADLGLPLYRLSSRLTSLDEVFLQRADHGS